MYLFTKNIYFTIILLMMFTCTSTFSQQKEGHVEIESSLEVDKLLNEKLAYNKSKNTTEGYKIQLFYGSEKGAYQTIEDFKLLFPDTPTKLVFSSPQWKVQVGNFITRLEADRAIVDIKVEFPGAIIVATYIDLEK